LPGLAETTYLDLSGEEDKSMATLCPSSSIYSILYLRFSYLVSRLEISELIVLAFVVLF